MIALLTEQETDAVALHFFSALACNGTTRFRETNALQMEAICFELISGADSTPFVFYDFALLVRTLHKLFHFFATIPLIKYYPTYCRS